jgi:16S rRNA processing protein RimM
MSGADRDDRSAPVGLRAGTVGRAHGLDGSFHVGAVVETVLAPLQVGSEVQVGGQIRRLARIAGHGARPILRLEGCDSRHEAEALRGEDVYVPRASAPALEQDEWWAEDLEGCAVRDGERRVGTVTALLELPSCEVLEVRRDSEGGNERPALLVPLICDAVRAVDIEAGVIDVDLAFLGES